MSFADNVASRVRQKLHLGVFSLAAYIRFARVSSNVNKSQEVLPLYPAEHIALAPVFSVQIESKPGSVPIMATDATK